MQTSREELKSMNEELQTVNLELQSKVDELSLASNDMKNLLNSTDIATIFLDNALHVRRFTTQAAALVQMIPGDVDRALSGYRHGPPVPQSDERCRGSAAQPPSSDREVQ